MEKSENKEKKMMISQFPATSWQEAKAWAESLGPQWRLPSFTEASSLKIDCTWVWTCEEKNDEIAWACGFVYGISRVWEYKTNYYGVPGTVVAVFDGND